MPRPAQMNLSFRTNSPLRAITSPMTPRTHCKVLNIGARVAGVTMLAAGAHRDGAPSSGKRARDATIDRNDGAGRLARAVGGQPPRDLGDVFGEDRDTQ